MKVLILTTVMAPYRVNLFNELGKYCDLTVCFEQENDRSRDVGWYVKATPHFECIPLKHWDRPVSQIKFDILTKLNIKKFDLAVAYEYSTMTGILFILACQFKKIPYLINIDGAFIERHFMRDLIKKFLISRAAGCLANGEHAKQYFLAYGAKLESIYFHHFTSLYEKDILDSPLKKQDKDHLRRELNLIEPSRIVMTVGRFIRSKRIEVLLSAWQEMPSGWLLLVVGSGELEAEYQAQVSELGLGNVRFTGHLESSRLKELYLASDLFVIPTESDVWGLVVNEAMAAGLPVISTDRCIAGLELIRDDYNGCVVPVGDSALLAVSIKRILLDEDQLSTFSMNALHTIQDHTYESIARSHMHAIQQTLSRKARVPECQSGGPHC